MQAIHEAIYAALKGDSAASVGLRTLLGNTTTAPYNVYHAFLPTDLDFSPSGGAKGFVTYMMVSDTPDPDAGSTPNRLMQALYNVTGYHHSLTSLEAIVRRIKWILQDQRLVTLPTAYGEVHRIRLDSIVGERWDDKFKVWWKPSIYRVWYRDDALQGS